MNQEILLAIKTKKIIKRNPTKFHKPVVVVITSKSFFFFFLITYKDD